MSDGIWISEAEVVELMALPDAIDALRGGLREEAAGRATNMVKTHVAWADGSTLHAIGAVFEGEGIAGAKVWAHAVGGAAPLLLMIDSNDGSVQAVIEAFALGQMRTGGISGLATDLMAGKDARRMAMIGAGKQSLAQVAAVAAVRQLDHVAVWSPTPAKREALAVEIGRTLGVHATAKATLEEALASADIVTLATRARTPFLAAGALARGAHVNAVGAITPERAEFEPALLDRVGLAAADSVNQVRRLSREFMDAYGDDEPRWGRLTPLSALVLQNAPRPPDADLTLFKAMGMGISDVSLGKVVLARAREAGLGRPLPTRKRVAPRLTARTSEKVV